MTDTLAKPLPVVVNYSKLRVTVTQGPDSGTTRELVSNPLRVGSSSDNDLALTDITVSRRHCSIEPLPSGVRIRDEGSTNGTFVGHFRVYDVVVGGTIQLRVGDSLLTIEPLPELVAREQATTERFCDLLGRSARMRELFADLARIAPTDVTVLIEGETGTGKELVAESVHAASERRDGPFIVFDCSAVAPTLAESELFGHERGAFTGASGTRPGVFEQADGGSIFLDELGELPKDLQPKLLRVLERREVRRLGGQRTLPVDVRLIAATNRNLQAEVARGNFREDLYFRLAAAHVHVPPLRDRMEDLPLIVEHFLSRAKPPRQLSDIPPTVWNMFTAHRWPGNVRELANAVQRFIVTPERVFASPWASTPERDSRPPGRGADSRPPSEALNVQPLRVARREASEAFERSYLEHLLQRTGGNVTRAAAIAEVSRQMVQKLMRRHGLG
jgi:transcriptional regulator with GAF, ATPase, and Fis domain